MTTTLPNLWPEGLSGYITSALNREACRLSRIHQLPSGAEEWKTLRPLLREKIWQSLGVSPDHNLDLDCRETGFIQRDGYAIKNIYYQSREDFYVTGNLYIPDGEGPFPGVLSMHGHWAQGRLGERVQSRGHTLAKNGYVCLAVDAFGSGERCSTHGQYEYHGGMLGGSLMNIGETLMGVQLVDNMRGIDLLCSLGFVCSDKIGATGASGGGNQTMWLAAMDDRIVASVPVASVGTFESYVGGTNCICETLPDGLTFMEESAAIALAAPNAVKICSCLGEIHRTFAPAEMLRTFTEARKIFQSLGADSKLSYQVFNRPHGYWPEIREAMLGWFDLHLRGIGHGAPKVEIPFQCLPERELMVFPEGGRDEKVVSIPEYCRKRGRQLLRKIEASTPADRDRKVIELASLLKTREALELKSLHRYSPCDGWNRFAVETECGRMVPLILKPASASKDYFVMAGTAGKNDLLATQLLAEALDSGAGIAIIELWGTGETEALDDSVGVLFHDLSRSCLWLGRTLIGEWVRDFSLVTALLKEHFQAEEIVLGGHKEAGLAALFSSVLSGKNLPVVLEDSPGSLGFHDQKGLASGLSFYSMALHLPGILAWGDIPLAVSLSGANVRFVAPRFSDGTMQSHSTSSTAPFPSP